MKAKQTCSIARKSKMRLAEKTPNFEAADCPSTILTIAKHHLAQAPSSTTATRATATHLLDHAYGHRFCPGPSINTNDVPSLIALHSTVPNHPDPPGGILIIRLRPAKVPHIGFDHVSGPKFKPLIQLQPCRRRFQTHGNAELVRLLASPPKKLRGGPSPFVLRVCDEDVEF